MNTKKKCSALFSETIRQTMKEMGGQKTRPQVIAISAKRTISNHPECRKFLERPQQKIRLDDTHWIIWSSKSFRLHRSKPCSIRIFFNKKAPTPSSNNKWKTQLKHILQEKIGICPRFGKDAIIPTNNSSGSSNNYMEIVITDPNLILALLNKRVAGFLD